jgi:eukaryotic-like serine/threonine-protein kinase
MPVDPVWLSSEFSQLEDILPLEPGGQKEVFRARLSATGEAVVLKLFHATSDPERAMRELHAVAGLGGQRVPRVIEVGTATSNVGEHVWFIEEFVDGRALADVLSEGPPEAEEVTKWAEQLLSTLCASEAAGIVHRDIKPANIIIDGDGSAWLLDFGIARHLGLQSVTPTSAFMGPHTPGYAPPEQFTNSKREIDARADLFALGVVLYECLEGTNPFTSDTNDAAVVLTRVASTDLPRVTIRAGVLPGFADLVQSMTRRPLSQRPPSAQYALDWLRTP